MHFDLFFNHDLLEDKCIDDVTVNNLLLFYHLKHTDLMFPLVCAVIDHKEKRRPMMFSLRVSLTRVAALRRVPRFCSYHTAT